MLVTNNNCPKHISCSAQLFQLPYHVHVFLFCPPVVLVVLYLRYRHLHHYYHRSMPEMHCMNISSLVSGLISALGLLIVGSFQVSVYHTHTPFHSHCLNYPPTHTHTHAEWQCTYYALYRSIHGVWFWYCSLLVSVYYHCASVEVSHDPLCWTMYGPHQNLRGCLLNYHVGHWWVACIEL